MPSKNRDGALWAVIGHLERQSVEEWKQEHYPQIDLEQALAVHLRSCTTRVERTPHGNVSVTFRVEGYVETAGHQTYFRLERAGNRLYKVVDPV